MTGTAQGKRTEAYLTWSPQAPPLLTVAVPLGIQVLSTGKVTSWSRNFMVFIFLIQIQNSLIDYFSFTYSNTL